MASPAGTARLSRTGCRLASARRMRRRCRGSLLPEPVLPEPGLSRGDAALPLPRQRRRRGHLRHVDRRAGTPLRRPGGTDHRDPQLRVGCGHGGGNQASAADRGRGGGRARDGPAAGDVAGPVVGAGGHLRPAGAAAGRRRRHAQPGRADTLLTDARGRAVVFGSGEPSGLTSTLPGVLTGLREVLGPDAPVLLAFDRGGAYPAAFTACRQAGADWVTYRRGALVEVTAPARRSRRGATGNASACRWPTRPCRSTVTALSASSPCSRTARRCCRC